MSQIRNFLICFIVIYKRHTTSSGYLRRTLEGMKQGSRGQESPSGVPGRGSRGRSPTEAAASLDIQGQKYRVLRYKVCSKNLCVVGFCEIAACSRIFGQNTKFLIIIYW